MEVAQILLEVSNVIAKIISVRSHFLSTTRLIKQHVERLQYIFNCHGIVLKSIHTENLGSIRHKQYCLSTRRD